MASSDTVRFVLYGVLLNGFLYGLTTYLYDIFLELLNLNVTNMVVATITVDIMNMLKPFIQIGPLFCLIFLGVMGILVANARSEKLSPYFGINAWGIVTYYTSICVSIVLTYVVSIIDGITAEFVEIFAVVPGSMWDYSDQIATAFAIEHYVIIALVILAAVYVIISSVSVESKQQVV